MILTFDSLPLRLVSQCRDTVPQTGQRLVDGGTLFEPITSGPCAVCTLTVKSLQQLSCRLTYKDRTHTLSVS